MPMRAIILLGVFFVVVGLASGVVGFMWARTEDTGNPVWAISGMILGIGILGAAWRMRPRNEQDQEILDLIFGDMSDPVQRAIMIRIFIAALIHGLALGKLFMPAEMTPVTLQDGLAGNEVMTFWAVIVFCLSLLWCIYECWRFYTLDEFWRNLSIGPIATAGVVLFTGTIFWAVARDYFGAPEIPVPVIYTVYWLTGMILMLVHKRARR